MTNDFTIVVLAKQVPDTHDVGKDAMNPDGTVNRAALPTVFNPEDLNALEMALKVRDRMEGAKVFVLTMGPFRAADIVRESLYRGADDGAVLTDRAFAGSDTLATSYALSCAINKIPNVKLVFGGRQAIDGDTAQVGPQVAEKLGFQQVTYAETLVDVNEKCIQIARRLDTGVEVVESPLPTLVTVSGTADECRFRIAPRLLKYSKAIIPSEAKDKEAAEKMFAERPYLKLTEWTAADVNPDFDRLGLVGSPTKVKNINNVVLMKKETVNVAPNQAAVDDMMRSLIGIAW